LDLTGINALIGGGIIGAAAGYFMRAKEFQRQQRLATYAEFVVSFNDLRTALHLLALDREHGQARGEAEKAGSASVITTFTGAWEALNLASAKLRLTSSRRTDHAAERVYGFVHHESRGVHQLAFKAETDQEVHHYLQIMTLLVTYFVSIARPDLLGRLEWRRTSHTGHAVFLEALRMQELGPEGWAVLKDKLEDQGKKVSS
jgi:hypothetical protein